MLDLSVKNSVEIVLLFGVHRIRAHAQPDTEWSIVTQYHMLHSFPATNWLMSADHGHHSMKVHTHVCTLPALRYYRDR